MIVSLNSRCALVLHYDEAEDSVCEATGMVKVCPLIKQLLRKYPEEQRDAFCLPEITVLVSPCFYHQRKRFYGDNDRSSNQCALLPGGQHRDSFIFVCRVPFFHLQVQSPAPVVPLECSECSSDPATNAD